MDGRAQDPRGRAQIALAPHSPAAVQDTPDLKIKARDLIRPGPGARANIPASVYRLQLNRDCTFRRATGILPFLQELGIQGVFCSPYFEAVPGSGHGYAVTDPNRVNPEIGSEREFESFCAAILERRMKQILDVVPNHMGIGGNANRFWMDVLKEGPRSSFAHFFDINWDPPKRELKNKVLLPILGDTYGRCLERGEIRMAFRQGSFFIRYFGRGKSSYWGQA